MSSVSLHKFFTFICFFLLAIFLIEAKLYASEIDNLYEATVSVKLDDENSKDPAIEHKQLLDKALAKVIYKVTGSKNFFNSPNLKKIMQQSESLVQKFSFQKKEAINVPAERLQNTSKKTDINPGIAKETEEKVEEQVEKKWFWARFSKRATDKLLKKYHLTIWESLRPDTLIWLSIEKDRKREITSLSTDPSIAKVLTNTSEQRGIKLIFPFADLQDREKLSSSDLWGNYSQAIKAASLRYHSQAILTIRIHQDPSGLWLSKWSLYVLDKVKNWNTKNDNLSLLLSQGINKLADKLAVLFALRSDTLNQNSSIIQVNNVTSFKGFLNTINYLKQVSAIQSSHLIQVKGDGLVFKVYYLGDEKHLSQSIALGDILQKVENSELSQKQNDQNQSSEYVSVILDNSPKSKPLPDEPPIEVKNIQPDLEFWLAQ
jgi:hypothetical protein